MNKRNGSVIIIALITIHAILILGAALLFIGRYHVAKTQADGYARNIAVTALLNYNNSYNDCAALHLGNKTEIKRCRLGKAIGAIQNTAGSLEEYNQLIGDPRQGESAKNYRLELATLDEMSSGYSGEKALLTPGLWTNKPEDCVGTTPPCFVDFAKTADALDPSRLSTFLSSDQEPNAFKVAGKLFPLGARGFFGVSFLGLDTLPVRVDATAAVVPKRGCFLVDVSNSTTALSHFQYGSRYIGGGTCASANPLVSTNRYCCPNGLVPEHGNYFAYSLNYEPIGAFDFTGLYSTEMNRHDVSYACMAKDYPNGSYSASDPYRHYRSNYRRMYALSDADLTVDLHGGHQLHPTNLEYRLTGRAKDVFWVDVQAEPEPLKTIFDGLNAAMQEFKIRAGQGSDKACIIFFDQTFVWPRMIKPTNLWDELIEFTTFSKDTAGSLAHEYSPPSTGAKVNAKGFKKVIRHGLFPYFTGRVVNSVLFEPQAFTYTKGAVEAALVMLEEDHRITKIQSSDFLVLITDGMTNCINSETCGNTYNFYKAAIADLKNYVGTYLAPRSVPLHVMLVGDHVRPNTRCIKPLGSSECFSDKEWRALDPETRALYNPDLYYFVDNNNFSGQSETQRSAIFENASAISPFSQVNRDYYEMAVSTQGQFIPIRKQQSPDGSACVEGATISFGDRQIIDVDPSCRSTHQQVVDALIEIVRFSPYAVVDVK